MKTILLALTVSVLFGCGGAPFTATDALATPTLPDAGTAEAEAEDVVTIVAVDTGLATEEASALEVEAEVKVDSGGVSLDGSSSSSGGSSSGSPAACIPGATQCLSDTQVQTCSTSGQWGAATTCTYACTDGNCGGSCVPGATQCTAGALLYYTVETCSMSGQWGAATTCPGGQCGSGQPSCCPCD